MKNDVLLAIAAEILVHISPEVTMGKRYRRAIADLKTKNPKISFQTSPLGMGHQSTWHGSIDSRVKGGIVVCHGEGENCEGEKSDAEDSASDAEEIGARTANLSQVVAINVVSSFTEKANHRLLSGFIPTVVLYKDSFRITLFDCTKDILLISNKKSFVTRDHLSQSGIALLWAVFNHR